jgi:hypothetical protein
VRQAYCKTAMRRFEPARRLHYYLAAIPPRLALFVAVWNA